MITVCLVNLAVIVIYYNIIGILNFKDIFYLSVDDKDVMIVFVVVMMSSHYQTNRESILYYT